jgi:hypothetical protein
MGASLRLLAITEPMADRTVCIVFASGARQSRPYFLTLLCI